MSRSAPTTEPVVGLGPVRWLAATRALVGQGARSVLVYRADVAVGMLSAAVRVVLVVVVWRAVYGSREQVAGVESSVAVGYAVLGALLNLVLQPWQFSTLTNRIRSGTVVFDLLRPIGLIPMSLAQQAGTTLAGLPRAAAGLALGIALGAVLAPAPPAAAAFLVSAALGAAVAGLCNLLISMTAFWTTEVGGMMIIYRMAAAFCSGALIPLWFMPDALSTVLRLLPFSAQVFTPLSIYFDPAPGWHTVGEIVVQLGWVLLLAAAVQLVWRRAIRRVVIFGG